MFLYIVQVLTKCRKGWGSIWDGIENLLQTEGKKRLFFGHSDAGKSTKLQNYKCLRERKTNEIDSFCFHFESLESCLSSFIKLYNLVWHFFSVLNFLYKKRNGHLFPRWPYCKQFHFPLSNQVFAVTHKSEFL